jgi:hypothetical protein
MTRRLQSILQTQIFALKIWWAGRDLICLQCESKINDFKINDNLSEEHINPKVINKFLQ